LAVFKSGGQIVFSAVALRCGFDGNGCVSSGLGRGQTSGEERISKQRTWDGRFGGDRRPQQLAGRLFVAKRAAAGLMTEAKGFGKAVDSALASGPLLLLLIELRQIRDLYSLYRPDRREDEKDWERGLFSAGQGGERVR